MRLLKRVFPIILFIMGDQGIKLYITRYMMEKEFDFPLVGYILGFKPYLNDKYSWVNSITNMGLNLVIHIILVIVLLILCLLLYDFIKIKYGMKSYVLWLFNFLFAGAICSLIDKVFWGGSLDFIWLKGFFIFDFKDIYVSIAEVMIILSLLTNKAIRKKPTMEILKDFSEYFKARFVLPTTN